MACWLLLAAVGGWDAGPTAPGASVVAAQEVELAQGDLEALARWLTLPQGEAPVLRRGSRGEQVRGLQAALTLAGVSPGRVDGHFGRQTERAVESFQAQHGLQAEDPATDPYVVALTFNDGPDDQVTPQLLDLLASQNVQATFFITGADGRRHPEIVRRMAREGHLVENHGWSHTPFHRLDLKAGEEEIESTAQLITRLAGRRSKLFRPPGAGLHPQGRAAAGNRGHQVLLWTNVGAESLPGVTAQDLVRWLQNPHPGAILMLHATNSEVLQALTILLPHWHNKGIHFVTLAGMVQNSPHEISAIET